MKYLLILGVVVFGNMTLIHAEEVPRFINMTGHWTSKAIEANPSRLMEHLPYLKYSHEIYGTKPALGEGINFIVCTQTEDTITKASLNYRYDAGANRSFGLIAGVSGPVIRGVIEHGQDSDVLSLFGSEGQVLSTEKNVWTTETSFISQESFTYDGGMAVVTYLTEKIDDTLSCGGK